MNLAFQSGADLSNLASASNLQLSDNRQLALFPDLLSNLDFQSANLEIPHPAQQVINDSRPEGEHPIPIGIGGHDDGLHPVREGVSRATISSPSSSHHDIILAIDLCTHTGWAVRDQHGAITSGVEDFTPHRFEGGGMRYLRFKQWLTELKATLGGIGAVYFEEVRRHKGVDAAHTYGGFMAHLTAWCEHHSIPYQGIPVGTIKKFITGSGNANKQAVMDAVRQRGFAPADDNEADALALLSFILNQTHGGKL